MYLEGRSIARRHGQTRKTRMHPGVTIGAEGERLLQIAFAVRGIEVALSVVVVVVGLVDREVLVQIGIRVQPAATRPRVSGRCCLWVVIAAVVVDNGYDVI